MFFIHWNIAPKFLSVRLRDADMETKQTAVYYGAVFLIDLPCSLVSPKLNLNYTRYLFFVCFVTSYPDELELFKKTQMNSLVYF